ncbi:hypothetical protein HZB60_11260 [candidate division KSB1 bacterium]|nr:hypothetical protein [candidate division KSB1 bacterium]
MDSTFFSESTGLYFYSALFQGNMALLGVLAVFLVFRLQAHEHSVNSALGRMADYARDVFVSRNQAPIPLRTTSVWELSDSIRTWAMKPKTGGPVEGYDVDAIVDTALLLQNDRQFCDLVATASGAEMLAMVILRRFTLSASLIVGVIVMSLVAMPLAVVIHEIDICVEALCFAITILTQLVALYLSVAYIRFAGNPSPNDLTQIPPDVVRNSDGKLVSRKMRGLTADSD